VRKQAEREWAEQNPIAYELRDDLLACFRYALRTDERALQQVSGIAQGRGHAEMIQDLTRLAAFGRKHRQALAVIQFDETRLELAANTADRMASLLAQATGERNSSPSARRLRDQAFTFLKQSVDEVRDAGKFVFRKQSDRLQGYSSAYFRRFNRTR